MAERPLDASTRLAAERTRLTFAWFQHRQEMRALDAEVGSIPYSISGIIAGLIARLGLFALVAVILRL